MDTDEDAPTEEPRPTTSTPTRSRTWTPPSEGKQKIRVSGEIIRTGDCVVVRDDNSITWTLTGDQTKDLEVGDRVRVTGAPDLGAKACGGPLVRTTSVTVTRAR
ncbi:DUF5818 domain-containing protein [Nocardioides gilvus]|uniref:DUF5818 domain-containing protein n=1 Tax=Nocardioides gilvus TaxID=1735589 RepID=UPI000D74CC04|nr:DUF5818 domain-containing protein [Nocardioides gilvus]